MKRPLGGISSGNTVHNAHSQQNNASAQKAVDNFLRVRVFVEIWVVNQITSKKKQIKSTNLLYKCWVGT